MGKLLDALKPQSSYAARKTPLWSEIVERVEACALEAQLDDFVAWSELNEMLIPKSWRDHVDELVDRRREELQGENIGLILKDRFDF